MTSKPPGRCDTSMVSRRGLLRASVLVGGGLAGGARAGDRHARGGPPPGATFHVRDFGAVGDGRTVDTRALQQAIDEAEQRGGGSVQLGTGTWVSGTLQLRRHVTIELAPGAVLLASPDDGDFAPREPPAFATRSDLETTDFAHALLAGHDLEWVAIRGTGVIDMNRQRRGGPKAIALKRCRFVTVQGITITRAPNYGVSLCGCDDVVVEGIRIRDAYADGIDPDCCRRVRIANCDVESDDDAICLKTSFALGVRQHTEDVVVTNCRLRSPSNCFKLGTESTGDFRQIVLSDCVFNGDTPEGQEAWREAEGGGIAILTVDGGTVDGVMISNVVMRDVRAPIFIRLGNRGRDQVSPAPGRLRNVSISAIVAMGASTTGSITGLPGHPVEGVTVDFVRITTAGGDVHAGLDVPEQAARYPKVTMYGVLPAFGLYVRHARDVRLRNLDLAVEPSDPRPALVADEVSGLHVAGFTTQGVHADGPAVWLNDVRGGLVEGGIAPEETGVFLRVTGDNTRGVAVTGTDHWPRGTIDIAPEAASGLVAGRAQEQSRGVGALQRP